MLVRTIGIIGAGTMGAGIAQVSAVAGFNVVLADVSKAAADKGLVAVAKNLDRLVGKQTITVAERARGP